MLPELKNLSHEAGLREADFSGLILDKIKHLKGVQRNTFFFFKHQKRNDLTDIETE